MLLLQRSDDKWLASCHIMAHTTVTFADSYLMANIEFRNKACTLGKYYSYTEVIFACARIYICVQAYIRCVMFLQWL